MSQSMTDAERAYLAAAIRGEGDEVARLQLIIETEQAAREERLNAGGAIRDAAYWYASHDIGVFPCAPGQKRPATQHGYQDATTDLEQIGRWWKVRPDYNLAAPTGIGFDVIDVDGPAGTLALGELKDAGGMPDIIAWAKTPHGFHYFIHPTGEGNRAGMLPDVDYRGAGGYVLLPPSRTPDGTYRWMPGHALQPQAVTRG